MAAVTIRKFEGSLKIAQKIVLKCNATVEDIKELERLARFKLKNTIVHPSNIIVIEFLNKKFTFTIASIEEQLETDVVAQLSNLSITGDGFYLVEQKTVINIQSQNSDPIESVADNKSLNDIGGMDEIIDELRKTMSLTLGSTGGSLFRLSRCALIYGLPGCGKTILAEALASSFDGNKVLRIESWKIFSKFYGESESNLRKIFNEAAQVYPKSCVILVDEISNICPKNDSSDVIRKVSSLLITLLDTLHQKKELSKVFVIATTNNLDNLDPAIRRSGRLDYEIEIPVPNMEMRRKILEKMLENLDNQKLSNLAKLTHGFVGADLEKLIGKSRNSDNGTVYEDILSNLTSVKPSAMRELMVEKPNVKWTDIGGMHDLKLKLKQIVEWPLQHPETFKRLGIKPPSGLLMFGPPGCSKTMIAKALATESNLNFISIKGSDLFSMWVGESEKAVRDLFIKARQLAPCIIFFDEIDAIGGERESGSSVKERVLAQILTEIDGVNVLKNVIIIAATNRPDLIDTALMRPGRLDRIVYVQLPDMETRREIFKIKLRNIPVTSDVDVDVLVQKTEGYSGAEIEGICKEAALKALEDSFDIQEISMAYFQQALDILKPRTSAELLEIYRDYEKRK